MHRIVVSIDNKKNTNFIIELLKKFSFVKIETEESFVKSSSASRGGSWTELIGIWKDREITINSIREKAWPKRI